MAGDGRGLTRELATQLAAARRIARKLTGGAGLAVELKLWLGGAVAVCIVLAMTAIVMVLVSAGSADATGATVQCSASPHGQNEIPPQFMPVYEAAAARSGLGDRGVWVLAGIHSIETNFSRIPMLAPAGAVGHMQFMPSTWAKGHSTGEKRVVVAPTSDTSQGYATDGDGDGVADTHNIHDAVHSAARYLKASGAPADWYSAIFAYNHAHWYVLDVLARADKFQGVCQVGGVAIGDLDWNDTSGEWAGSMKFAKALADLGLPHGCRPTSEKRGTKNIKDSNSISDHWEGNTIAYAVDIAGCGMTFPGGPADKTAQAIAQALGLPAHTGTHSVIRGQYRIQLLWQTWTGGNHYDHIHVGVKFVGSPAA